MIDKCAAIWKIFEREILSEKNPTSTFKIGGGVKKNVPQIFWNLAHNYNISLEYTFEILDGLGIK